MSFHDSVISSWENYSHQSVSGVGKIMCQYGHAHECNLQLWHLKNGHLVVNIESCTMLKCDSDYSFEGISTKNALPLNDWSIEITQIQRNHESSSLEDPVYYYLGKVRGNVSIYDVGRTSGKCRRVICELINLSLSSARVQLDLKNYKIEIVDKGGAEYYISRSFKNPSILGELRMIADKPLSTDEWNDIVARLCCFLSLAQRNYVTKASMYKFNDPDNKYYCQKIYPLRGIQATKASRYPLIASKDLPSYLKRAIKKIPQVYSNWNFLIALDHYLQAMDSKSSWSIGVGLVVAMECLVSAFASGSTEREYHFGEMDNFKTILPDISTQVLEQLEKHFPESTKRLKDDSSERTSWESSFMVLNRRSFGRKVRSMLDELGIEQPRSNVLQRYINLRNDLVHYGYPVTSRDFSDDFKVMIQMADFLEKIFLKIIGYDGPVIGFDEYIIYRND